MEKIVEFDYAALVLLLFLLFSVIFRKMTKGTSNHMFIFVLLTMLASTVFDIGALWLDNSGTGSPTLMYLFHTGYLMTHNLTTPAYVMYIISLTDTWHKLNRSIVQQFLLCAPYAAVVTLLIINLFNDCMFSVAGSVYSHSGLFWVLYAAAGYYAILGLCYLFIYRKIFTPVKIITISSIVPFMAAAIIIQWLDQRNVVEMFATSLSLLLISMTIQRPEEILDTFTGLRKYSAYADDIKRSFAIGKQFTIIMLNIDGFAMYQSSIGFDDSTRLLKRIAAAMDKLDRKFHGKSEDYYLDRGRFRMVFSGKNRTKAKSISYHLYNDVLTLLSEYNLTLSLTPYICVTNCPEDAKSFNSLQSFGSDFYEKTTVSNHVIFASELFKLDKFDMTNNIDIIIERAFKNKNFRVYYQPIYSVEDGRFSSAEALLRLIDDQYGFVPPDIFITAAEKSGAIHKIGDFVLDEVCRFIASNDFKQLNVDYIEINLSVTQCMQDNLAEKVMKTLKKYSLTPNKINLEITETAVSKGQDIMQNNLDTLSAAGISFSLDDYGTGYSNMRRVIQLPLKIVKLDKSFVDEQSNPKMWVVLQNTVKMLKEMNMEIVVEGIEDKEMAEQFKNLNCDFIQGYYYSRPIPQHDYVEFVKKAHKAE